MRWLDNDELFDLDRATCEKVDDNTGNRWHIASVDDDGDLDTLVIYQLDGLWYESNDLGVHWTPCDYNTCYDLRRELGERAVG